MLLLSTSATDMKKNCDGLYFKTKIVFNKNQVENTALSLQFTERILFIIVVIL